MDAERLEYFRRYRANNRERIRAANSRWARSEAGLTYRRSYIKIYNKTHKGRLIQRWIGIQKRCHDPEDKSYKWYGGRGIKNLLTVKELEILWERDGASLMEKPSIDRKNSNDNYTFDNCEFVEMVENLKRKTGMKYRGRNLS